MSMPALPCIVCAEQLENVGIEAEVNQPYGGTAFTSYGHYGSTVFDPMDRSHLEINVCDDCLVANAGRARHTLELPSPPQVIFSKTWEPALRTAEFDEDDEDPAAVAAAFEAGEKGLTRRPEADVLRGAAPGIVERAAAAARRMAGEDNTSAAIMASIVRSALWQALGCTCSDHTDEGAVYFEDLTCPMHGTVAEVSVQRGAPDD